MTRAGTLGAEYRSTHGLRASATAGGARQANGEDTSVTCDRCGQANYRKIKRKTGKGTFLACPACRMTRDVRAKVRPGACPTCASALIEKKIGKKAPFWGCVRYGAETAPCSYADWSSGATKPASPDAATPAAAVATPRFRREATDKTCPRCSVARLGVFTPIEASGGAPFYACEDRRCRFRLPVGARRRRLPCPQCRGMVLERWVKPDVSEAPPQPVWRCARHPQCAYEADWTA